ncbi:MAG: hypothetical protein ABIO05_06705 [Ferruginibacter sp.]
MSAITMFYIFGPAALQLATSLRRTLLQFVLTSAIFAFPGITPVAGLWH